MTWKIIILGGNGFIGTNLLKNFSSNSSYSVRGYSSRECNLLSIDSINSALSSITSDSIIIMTSSINRLKENTYNSMIKNITMAENIGRFIEGHPVGYLIFLSTVDVYGIVKNIINEKLLPDPNDYYAMSKLSSEFILKKYCTKGNIPLLIMRLSGVYGHGDEGKSTMNRIIDSIATTNRGIIWGDGTDKRDFVYVDDVCRIINMAIEKKIDMTLNVATGKSYSINQIFDIIKSCYPGDFIVEYKPKEKNNEERVKDMVYDTSLLAKAFLGFRFIDLHEGISLYLKERG